MPQPRLFVLWFGWIPRFGPRLKSTPNGHHVAEAVIQQDLRRTGAAFFRRSGAVHDDPLGVTAWTSSPPMALE